jgi:prophage maintenance system killer protein/prophage antirepressor-like protein
MKLQTMTTTQQDLVIFKTDSGDVTLQVKLDNDTVWLTLAQISELFDVQKPAIHKHLKNIYNTDELSRESTVSNLEIVQTEGTRDVKRNLELYNLDAIIAIGYRVNSKRATQFRKWASSVLKEHLVQGYTFHHQRLYEKGMTDLQKAMDLLAQTLEKNTLVTDVGQGAVDIINAYAKTWNLLLAYDEDRLSSPANTIESNIIIDYETILPAIEALKHNLIEKGEATPLFGQQRDEHLKALFGNIHQTFDDVFLYPSSSERAAHLLYFVIKDHPFVDGNKRIGSFLFLLYLNAQDSSTSRVNDSTLVALALLIAESDPKDKDLMIKLVMNLISKE